MNTIFRFASLVAMFLGIVGLFSLADGWITSRSYGDWQSTRGVVTVSQLINQSTLPAENHSSQVIYDYEVDGVTYRSTTISHGFADGSLSAGHNLVETYPKGTEVTVYYDPYNPEDSVLKLTEMNTFIAIFIAFLLTGMVVMGFFGWRGLGEGGADSEQEKWGRGRRRAR